MKYALPRVAGPSLARLVGQMRAALTSIGPKAARLGASNGRVVLWSLREPSLAQLRLVYLALGEKAYSVQFVNGVLGLWQWLHMFFIDIASAG